MFSGLTTGFINSQVAIIPIPLDSVNGDSGLPVNIAPNGDSGQPVNIIPASSLITTPRRSARTTRCHSRYNV